MVPIHRRRPGAGMSAWRGNISALGQLANNIGKLATVPSRAARDASAGIARLIDQQFANGTDPYGKPWKPLAQSTRDRGRFPPPLTDTRDMRDSVAVKPSAGAGITVTIGAPYAGFHQTGAPRANMPARKILPEGPMPKPWQAALAKAVYNLVTDAFGAGR